MKKPLIKMETVQYKEDCCFRNWTLRKWQEQKTNKQPI